MFDINKLLKQVVCETTNLRNGKVFLLRDRFRGYEWNRISRGNHLLLGKLFLIKISSKKHESIANKKASSRKQKYQIVRGKKSCLTT